MKYIIIAFFGVLLSLSACTQKELPQPEEGEPQVWLAGNSNGIPFEVKAGINAIYANTLTHDLDTLFREFVFTASLPKTGETIIINLYDSFTSYPSIAQILDHSIYPGEFKYTYSNTLNFNLAPKNVVVRYINQNHGLTYYSYQYAQNPQANFTIVSVKDVVYEGKPYKLAEVRFNCKLRCPQNNWLINMTDVHGFIPFGQK